ncbi:TFIIA-domain-containing protein [Ophiobolus disseminans]|uniref:TFIIA-domain-containing protein n=1 Tax=Ophiobolus disseminans TaxID=1469910 RepID=A0A6A6ZHQ8_9PLEO|nr:TFIIA-domain-containing protein [Ophiobolus disseminans]
MSNYVVGQVYAGIIDKVIAASVNDFEEFGAIAPSVHHRSTTQRSFRHRSFVFPFLSVNTPVSLRSLHFTVARLQPGLVGDGRPKAGLSCRRVSQGWQEKLSALHVAAFPWDPPAEAVRQPPVVVPSNVKVDTEHLAPVPVPQESLNFPNVAIKSEGGGYVQPISNYPQAQTANGGPYTGGYDQNMAQQRAAALVQQRVQQDSRISYQNHHQQTQQPQMPMQGQQQPRMMAPQQPRMTQQMPQQQRPPQGHLYNSQTDGAGDAMADWNALKAARAAALQDEVGRLSADQFMRARVDAMAMRQDSGLMVPLNSMPKGKKRRAAVRVIQEEDAEASSSAPGPARFDGEDEVKEEDPEDAINSDLDDPEDDLHDGDNSDDDMVDYMLCTYDKVQRVKNKWKCVLKDGILTTNKKEYLFHKATGEFEW